MNTPARNFTGQKSHRIVFMGNSIIQGWGQSDPEFFSNPDYVNRGIGGQTTSEMLLRFENDVIDAEPKAVLILAGTNDIAGNSGEVSLIEIRDNIGRMAIKASENDIQVILCSVLPAFDYPWRRGRDPHVKIPQLNAMISELAEDKGYYYLDYFSVMSDNRNGLPREYAVDGVHPTEQGYRVMKKLTLEAFEKMQWVH